MNKKLLAIATICIIIIVILAIIVYPIDNPITTTSGIFSISIEEDEFEFIDPINVTFELYNDGSEPITIADIEIGYNTLIYITNEDDGRHARSNFYATSTPSNITVEPETPYSKEIEINQYPDTYIYLNVTDNEFAFLFEPGNYTVYASYIDRALSEEDNIVELYRSNEIHIHVI